MLNLFFSSTAGDTRGTKFAHLAYNGMDFTRPINVGNPNSLITEPVYQLMSCQNMTSPIEDSTEDSISHNFIQFIIDTAKYHRELDDNNPIDETDTKKNIFNNIYLNPNADLFTRKLFTTFIHVVEINTNRVVTDFARYQNRLGDIRFNLAKVDVSAESKQRILFAETLPLLPEIVDCYYLPTDNSSTFDTIKNTLKAKLQSIYDTIKKNPVKSGLFATALAAGAFAGLSYLGILGTAVPQTTSLALYYAPTTELALFESVSKLSYCINHARMPTFIGNLVRIAVPRGLVGGGANKDDDNKLTRIFADIYNVAVGLDIAGIPLETNDKKFILKLQKSTATDFGIDNDKFYLNVIKARDRQVPRSSSKPTQVGFDDLYESVVTGVRYIRNKDGELVELKDDGTHGKKFDKTEIEAAVKQGAPNCATTGINVSDCTDVYKCLLSGRPETLSECLDKLANANMFEVARKEVNKMNPQVAVQLLRTFGFKPRKEAGSNTLLPPTFDEWKRKLSGTVGATTASTILNNSQLMKYLQAVVSIVRSNPAIINTNVQSGLTSDFSRKSGLTIFRNPFPEKSVSSGVIDGVVFNQNQMIPQVPLALRIANISSRMQVPLNLVGGGEDACVNSAQIRKTFKLIFAEMEKNGKVLVESDKARIDASIEKLGKLESQLIKLMEDAKLFARLSEAFKSDESVTLKDISNVRDNTPENTLSNLNDCINKNVADQSQLSSDLVNKVQMPLLELLLGRTNPLLNQL